MAGRGVATLEAISSCVIALRLRPALIPMTLAEKTTNNRDLLYWFSVLTIVHSTLVSETGNNTIVKQWRGALRHRLNLPKCLNQSIPEPRVGNVFWRRKATSTRLALAGSRMLLGAVSHQRWLVLFFEWQQNVADMRGLSIGSSLMLILTSRF